MAIEERIVRKGIFSRTTRRATTVADGFEILKEISCSSQEEYFRTGIASRLALATSVLERAGLPSKPGLYVKAEDGTLEHLGNVTFDEVKDRLCGGVEFVKWPYFVEREPLSVEDFAVSLIHNAHGLLSAAAQGNDCTWAVASMALFYAQAEHNFRLAVEGVASRAETGIKNHRATKKGANTMSQRCVRTRTVIMEHCKAFLSKSSGENGPLAIAISIRKDVNLALGRTLTLETVQKHVQKLASNGMINLK